MPNVELRSYQVEMVEKILSSFNNHSSVMCQMPTGTGKTEVFIAVIQQFLQDNPRKRVLVIVHRKELLRQVVERLRKNAGIRSGIIVADQPVDFAYQVHVGMIKSLRRDQEFERSLVVIDEAHHSVASEYQKHIDRLTNNGATKLLGVTATPARLDSKRLSDIFSKLLVSPSVKWFIEKGHLSKIRYYGIKNIDLGTLRYSIWLGDYEPSSSSSLMRSETVLAETLSTYLEFAQGKKTLIFCVDIAHSKAVLQKFWDAGIDAVEIDSETDTKERDRRLDHFRNTDDAVMINVQLFNEGFDCPDIEVVILARPTQSITLYMQMIGRVTRKAKGKDFGVILDNAGNYKIHGTPTSDFDWVSMFTNSNGLSNLDFSAAIKKKNRIRTRRVPKESQEVELVEIIDEFSFNTCYDVDLDNSLPFNRHDWSENVESHDLSEIDDQIWMRHNLNVDRFRNGDPIPEARTAEEWKKASDLKQPAWCHYDNDPNATIIHGKLYNGYAVMDSRGLAPDGWRIPLDTDWEELSNKLGGEEFSGWRLKCDVGWKNFGPSSGNGINDILFDGLPGGFRSVNGVFDRKGSSGFWWSFSKADEFNIWNRHLTRNDGCMLREKSSLGEGLSVRCLQEMPPTPPRVVKDPVKESNPGKPQETKNDIQPISTNQPISKVSRPLVHYESVTIGSQTWMKQDLNIGFFRNGDKIICANTTEMWRNAIEKQRPAYCYYDGDWGGEMYGRLYNRFAVMDPRGLAPEGWSIPSESDWNDFISYLSGNNISLFDLQKKNWSSSRIPNGMKSNKTEFSALPGGYRNHLGQFIGMSIGAHWWMDITSEYDRCAILKTGHQKIHFEKYPIGYGFSIRCLKIDSSE